MSISSSTSPADSPFSADQPPPPSPPTALPPLVVTPIIALAPVISPPAPPLDPLPPPLPQLPSPSASPPAEAPLAADPPLAASTPPVQDVTPPSPPSPVLLPPLAAATPPSATPIPVTSPPAPELVPAAPDTSSLSPPAPPLESKSPPTKPSRKHRSPRQIPSTPSTPAKPQAQPLPTLLSPSPASPPTAIPSFENAPPTSFGPIFPELPLAPPVSLASPPVAPELVTGSLPVTINGGQSQPIGGQRTTEEFHVATGLIVGFAIAGGLLLAMLVLSCFICRRRKKQSSGGEKDYYGSQPSGIKVVKNGYHDVLSNHNAASTKPHLIEMPPPKSSAPAALTGYSPVPVGSRGQAVLPSSLSMSIGVFTYDELTEATENFSASNLLGEGGFGYVHKGVLSGGKEIAVKQLKIGSHQGEREFQAELDTISRVHHKHLVTLLGYCITGEARFLVYEFVPNKTLEFHLHGIGQPVMDWATRLKIAVGSAKGLAYLHEDCSPTIIHRDIKAANILLDFKFEAKVSDFGLAKFFSDTNSHVTHISTRVVGTFGYLAPEYASSGKLTEKSDVYSYGVMLLELITGRPPISRSDTFMTEGLVDWARPLLNQAIRTGYLDDTVDPRLQKNYDSNEMVNLIECAAACVRHSAWLRPRMSQIVRALEENEPLTDHEEGYTPGHSKLYSSLDMKKLTMALASQDCESSRLSDNTSEYGLYPSCSSSEAHMAR